MTNCAISLRKELAVYGRAIVSIEDVADMGDSRPLQLSVQGPDMTELDRISAEVMDRIRKVPGAVDIDRSLDPDKPEIKVRIDRKLASDLGIDLESLAMTMRTLLNGEVATQFEDEDGDAYDVRVRLADQERRSAEILNRYRSAKFQKGCRRARSFDPDRTGGQL